MRWLVTLVFCFSATMAAAQEAPRPPQGQLLDQIDMNHAVQRAYVQRDFATLTTMAREFRVSKARTTNGGWKLRWFHYALAGPQGYTDHRCPDEAVRFAEDWIKAFPDEPAAYVMNGSALLQRGWCFRGDGLAAEVTPNGRRLFAEGLTAARKVLEDNRDIASTDPHYYATMVIISKADGTDAARLMKLIEEASKREPLYHQTYIEGAGYFMTNWQGQPGDLRRFTDYALARTKDEGASIYARIFWNYYDCNCFHRSDLDWGVLRRGMVDLVDRFPDDWTAGGFARIACREADTRAASVLMSRMQGPDTGIAWSTGDSWQGCRLAVESDRENRELQKTGPQP